ncbi:MAG TPA: PAS domain S-box protein, partial [Bacteroidia bacterium]|nr:PAS domain S-box protein [Bacteroidia bacterium]
MTLSSKTKSELIIEVKKLQRKLDLVQKKHPQKLSHPSPTLKDTKWDSFFKNSLNIIIIVDRKGIILDINKVTKARKKEDVVGKSAYSFVAKDAEKNMKTAIEKVFKTKKSHEYNTWRVDEKGASHFYKSKATAIIENKKVVAAVIDATDITNEIESHIQLKESEAKFRMLAENATDLIYRCRLFPDFCYEYISPSVKTFTGYSAEEFYAQPFLGFKIVHPEDVHLLGDSENLIKNKSKISNVKGPEVTVRWIKKDGSVIWTETRNKPVFDKQKRLIAIEGISRDITKQKTSEEKLKDSEERFKILSNATFEGIIFSENGKIIDANDQFVEMYGYKSSKEIIGKKLIDDFVVEEQRDLARKFVRLPITKPWEVDTIKKDGTIITVESKGQNIPYFGRTIRATVIYNITERKQYEFNLRESERTLSTLMNNLPGMAYRCDNDDMWTMRFVSKGFQELTGYNPKDIVYNKKRSFADIIHPNDRNHVKKEIRKAVEKISPFEIEYRLITASGQAKWVLEKGEGVFSEDGNLLFLEGFITDIGDKKQFEQELKRSRENYKSLVDYSPDGVIIHIDGIVKFANPSALKMIGVD